MHEQVDLVHLQLLGDVVLLHCTMHSTQLHLLNSEQSHSETMNVIVTVGIAVVE